ncbi:MAG TPA: PLP-dependent aminotransferase family protein [Rhizomicrobium sp.]
MDTNWDSTNVFDLRCDEHPFKDVMEPSDLPLAIANIRIDPGLPVPIYQQLCSKLRDAIIVGDLPPGTRIPTSRELSVSLGVGRNTVVTAYSQLAAEGYLATNRRRGTEVARLLLNSRVFDEEAGSRSKTDELKSARSNVVEISFRARQNLQTEHVTEPRNGAFSLYAPDPSLFPRNPLGRLLAEEFGRASCSDMATAKQRFQAALAAYLRHRRGVCCAPEQIIPVASMASALNLALQAIADPGHCAAVEDPAAPFVRQAFASEGMRVLPLPSDAAGADAQRWSGPPPRMIFVSPSVGCPLGRQLTEDRRTELLRFSEQANAVIFEADVSWELSYQNNRLRALQGQDQSGRVLYFGDMNETLGPHIRIGYLVVPSGLRDAFQELANRAGYGPDSFILAAVARFMEENQYPLHVRSARASYAQRLEAMVRACNNCLPGATVMEPAGGLHLTILLPDNVDESAVSRLSALQGLPVAPLSSFYQGASRKRGIVLAFGTIAERNIEMAARRLAGIVAQSATPLELVATR